MPGNGGYWFAPDASASAAAASISGGPSVSGNPWPRLIDPVRTASADISEKIVVPNGRIRATSASAEIEVVPAPAYGGVRAVAAQWSPLLAAAAGSSSQARR